MCVYLFQAPNLSLSQQFPGGSDGKTSAYNSEDMGSIPGSGSCPGEGNGNPLQYSCLGNSMDGGAWWATVHGVTKSRTGQSDFTLKFHISLWVKTINLVLIPVCQLLFCK